ncbi:archaetidylinositol phosphate synthase [Acidilobus sp.]|uniref:archaetidylinositol phosphate synthase n=1 Tax=Acidilobus sp. TaxID=1872109 RepID=UPI003D00EACA
MLGKLRKLINSLAPTTVGKALYKAGVTPDELTYMGLALSALAPLAVYLGKLIALPFLILLAGLMDVLDGAVARASGRTTAFGSYLDSMTDRVSDAFLFLAMALAGVNQYITLIALAFSLMVSYARAKGELLNVKMEGVGLAERSERLIILFVMSLLLLLRQLLVDDIIMAVVAVLAAATVIQRSVHVKRSIGQTRTTT